MGRAVPSRRPSCTKASPSQRRRYIPQQPPTAPDAAAFAAEATAAIWPNIDWSEGGFSLCLNGDSVPAGADTFIVSIHGHEVSFRGPPTEEQITRYVAARYATLSRPGHFVGGWLDDSQYVLDVSRTVEGEEQALEFARQQHQRAVYHPATDRCIAVAEHVGVSEATRF